MKKVLILVPGYLPGFKSGGPVRTIQNLIESLSERMSFSVLCGDRDLGDKTQYPDVQHGEWNKVGSASVFYIPQGLRGYFVIYSIVTRATWDSIYLNSFFSFRFSIFPILLKRFFGFSGPILLGPRGEFSKGALALKAKKKRLD